jgi:quinohemoprotein ethanol dehydrogenase
MGSGEPRGSRFSDGSFQALLAVGGIGLVLIAGIVGWGIGRSTTPSETVTVGAGAQGEAVEEETIAAAPAFSADDLTAEPSENWITNGGTLMNQRYSPLDQIDTKNVADLKGVWRTHLRKSATAAKYSAESQPLVYDGVIYVPTGEDDVFAVSVATGNILWHHAGNLDPSINTVCCGWLSRGVALGDGMVYIGRLDGTLMALDQQTGKQVWQTKVGDWRKGYTVTAAPLYYDGMIVTGVSGGEFSIRGRVQAYDAKTGKEVWRFYTIPGPGEVGHDTWPQDNESWQHGGAPVWQTPAVDPELGLLYFSTGNASPDLNGAERAGDNLFASSIVALDVKTGKHRWHFQQVHHDIWDYDGPSPVVLFDADGKKGIAQASKTGWLYMLDRKTGKPLFDIKERAVPQNEAQKTAKTQPIPSYDPFIPHEVSDADYEAIVKLVKKNAKGGRVPPSTRAPDIYEPFDQGVTVITPGPQGGTNWQPVSYNPDTEMFYVCAMGGTSGYTRSKTLVPKAKQGGVADFGGTFTSAGFGSYTGYLSAIDATSGEIKWQKRWPESCYAGSVTTAGGLVFVGRNGGDLQAYDAKTGDQLWSFQTGAGANSTATVFEQDGKEYLVFYAGGNSLAATAHGDNLWLFSLDGKLGPAKAAGAGEGAGHAGETPPETSTKGDPAAGKTVFADNCSGCHGLNGTGGNGGPDLSSMTDVQRVIGQVTNGGGGMPPFKDNLTQQQIRDVAAYVTEQVGKKG